MGKTLSFRKHEARQEMAQTAKSSGMGGVSWMPRTHIKKLGVLTHSCHVSAEETEDSWVSLLIPWSVRDLVSKRMEPGWGESSVSIKVPSMQTQGP